MGQSASRAVRERPKNTRRLSFAEMQAHIDALEGEVRAARKREAATGEILGVINSSHGDLAPVFDAILGNARTLCDAELGTLFSYDGERFWPMAVHGAPPQEFGVSMRDGFRPTSGNPLARVLEGEPVVHIADIGEVAAQYPNDPGLRVAVGGGLRTFLIVPLRRDNTLLGVISALRKEVRPFSDRQIALLQNFAAQAVIAMENARLLTEAREALEQQTATAEVLGVINASPGDLAPVFDAMLEKALHLCDAASGIMWTFDGERAFVGASRDVPGEFLDYLKCEPPRAGPNTFFGRAIMTRSLIHSSDIAAEEPYQRGVPLPVAAVELGRIRAALFVPLVKDDAVPGIFSIFRKEVRPFTSRQIALLQNFAAQAVIAMENVRLLTETREALEQQTATADVLQVINSSPGNLAPVFDAILEKAHTLCGAAHGSLQLYDGENLRAVATHAVSDDFAEVLRHGYRAVDSPASRELIEGRGFVQISDCAQIEHAIFRSAAELSGIRTVLFVPLRRDDALLGLISAARREVRPFSEKQIALLQNFAAQAVIAMDNARLLNEIRQRQAELRVTFDNMGDGVAMFDNELRLAAWNRNFQEMLDLPEEFLAKRPRFAEYFRYLAGRGEYASPDLQAELSRFVEDTAREMRFERTRPDGRVIEVRRNAVPGGGFVLIYGDVTERKRAEAEIRAARDAAEGALHELKAAQASLIHAEKMASLGQLTAGIAHEIKNPLNFVNNFAGLSVELLDELRETAAPAVAALGNEVRAEVDEIVTTLSGNLAKIAEHGKRADGIVTSMLAHSRGGSREWRQVDLNALVDEALNLAYHGARAQDQSFNIVLERDLDRSISPIELVPQDVTRVLLNLIGNGLYAANKRRNETNDPAFTPRLKMTTRELGNEVEIRVRDNGTGIAPEYRDRLFQPFFTTKPTGEGTGLGLSISYDIVTAQHGGTITVDGRVGDFTELTVRLPRQSKQRITAEDSKDVQRTG